MILSLDLETRSPVDLINCGAHKYFTHPDTDVICAAWSIGDMEPELWIPGMEIPTEIFDHVNNGRMVAAWNAQFERLAWQYILLPRYRWPQIKLEQFICTAATARSQGFPGALANAALFAGLPQQKDQVGHRLMLKLCRPAGFDGEHPLWYEDPAELAHLYEYCRQDVRTEHGLARVLRPLPPEELELYHLTERLNDRGVRVDVKLAEAAVAAAEIEAEAATTRLIELTEGQVTTHNQIARILSWVEQQWRPLPGLSKGIVAEALEDSACPDQVREVLEIRQANGKAAVSKFQAILDRQINGRVHGLYLYCGAGQTARWSSCLVAETQILVYDSHENRMFSKRIIDVLPDDLVWDGLAFVPHGGVAFQGFKEVIEYDGITGTTDHTVYTAEPGGYVTERSLSEAKIGNHTLALADLPSADALDAARKFAARYRSAL